MTTTTTQRKPRKLRKRDTSKMRVVETVLTDDLTGKKAAETIKFSLDGQDYEIDLSRTNAKKLRSELAPYVEAGRKVKRSKSTRKTASRRKSGSNGQGDTAAIREWALANGYEVNARGRIPASVKEAYANANGGGSDDSTDSTEDADE